MVYLDYNATAPVRPEAARAAADALSACGNPSSVHGYGRAARKRVEDARERIAALVNAPPAEIIFTSGGTEANMLALRGAGRPRILVSAIEHDSVLAAAPQATPIPVTPDGVVDLAALEGLLDAGEAPALVSVMLANNETGVIQPVADAAALSHQRGALVHCDAVQAAGKIPVDFAALGVDLLSISGHKLGGPQGVGALVAAQAVDLASLMVGGGQERSRRAGTENVSGIAGFGAAAAAAARDLGSYGKLAGLRDRLEAQAKARVPTVRVHGEAAARLPNTSCLGLDGVPSETQVMALDLAGVAISAGSACSSGKVRPSHVLRAMGADDAVAASAVRVSLGWGTAEADVDAFLDAWADLYARKSAA